MQRCESSTPLIFSHCGVTGRREWLRNFARARVGDEHSSSERIRFFVDEINYSLFYAFHLLSFFFFFFFFFISNSRWNFDYGTTFGFYNVTSWIVVCINDGVAFIVHRNAIWMESDPQNLLLISGCCISGCELINKRNLAGYAHDTFIRLLCYPKGLRFALSNAITR